MKLHREKWSSARIAAYLQEKYNLVTSNQNVRDYVKRQDFLAGEKFVKQFMKFLAEQCQEFLKEHRDQITPEDTRAQILQETLTKMVAHGIDEKEAKRILEIE